jgi:hypothetical protein
MENTKQQKSKIPQRRTNTTMSGKMLLDKAINGSYIKKGENQLKNEEIKRILDK